ncbi:MAG: UDP-N-acetylmuramoyl-L-alanyl-D-glutamate--2,6-diaminopimelate ligase [Candidatus Eisenbacteria bacterium]|uniref:UDP-N-acetylmuramoyl-L-alanyl-D-glutamate--2,6-diaminopimelate ligase n=1 Tax=Eiseniibacteriota bacterium TaxID=2212470 RepID=A0A538T7W5_UNCEI|nr:MAG: UDP-N-acetylmuramoyl-L-alanyl-D-glutamate--2,6-diaminopimelate ligase [Candidatus Eisenbacteria bacterium]
MIGIAVLRTDALPGLLGASETTGALRGEWEMVRYDSREVNPRDLFVAVPGLRHDGHAYVEAAARSGASAAVVERFVPEADLPQVLVADTRRALAILAGEETGHPSREMVLAGVTGTNGKTTTAHLIRAVFEEAGHRAGFIGTVGYEFEGRRESAPHTTPEAPDLMRMLRAWRARGATAVAMEVSSHALALERTYGVAFDVGVFTNLTQDHLDFHGTLESYREAKARLFHAEARGDRTKRFSGAVNVDDPAGLWIRARADCPIVGFGMGAQADIRAEDVRSGSDGTQLRIRERRESARVSLRLRGAFNAMNALAAFAAGRALEIPTATIVAGLERLASVPGRLEPVDEGQPFQVLVDYAHTPDALARALGAVREFGPRRLLCVFGCGGDRDKGKRPLMGAAAVRLADQVILTSDNPRGEDPASILREIEAGVGGAANVRTIEDRASAIAAAIDACAPGDALLIAGKGHETYQIIGARTLPFDDREVARAALRHRGFGR